MLSQRDYCKDSEIFVFPTRISRIFFYVWKSRAASIVEKDNKYQVCVARVQSDVKRLQISRRLDVAFLEGVDIRPCATRLNVEGNNHGCQRIP